MGPVQGRISRTGTRSTTTAMASWRRSTNISWRPRCAPPASPPSESYFSGARFASDGSYADINHRAVNVGSLSNQRLVRKVPLVLDGMAREI